MSRLDDAEVALMAQACLGGAPVPPTLEDLLHAWAEGLPFLVEEVLAACVESGVLAPTPGGWTVSGEHKLPVVPRTFAGMVQRRQSALDGRTRLVLAAAALLGQHFDWSLLPAVCDLSAGEVLVSLRAAVDVQLVAVDDDDTGGAFRFRHALSREAVLDQLLPPERAALARRAADTIEAAQPELAGDWCELSANLHALGGRRSRAAGLFLEVGRRSLARGALVSAEQAFVRAGSLAGDTVLAAQADESLLAVLTLAGKAERALAVGGELLGRLEHLGAGAERRLAVHLRLAQAAIAATRWDTASMQVDVARSLATSTDHGEALPRADVLSAQVAVGQARLEAAEVLARRALDGAELSGQPDVACEALEVIGRLARLHDLTEAERAFERARAMALENGLTVWHLRALHELGTIDSLESGALERLVETREAALSIGALATAAVADLHLAATLSTRFDPDGALEAASRCSEISRRFRLGTLAASLVFQAASWAQRGDRRRAEAVLAEALEAAGDEPDIAGRAWGWVRAISSLLDEDHERAMSELDRGIEFMRPGGIGPHPFTGLGVLLHTVKGGRGDEARSEVHAAGSKVALYNRAYLGYADAVALGRRGAPDDAMRAFVVAETELGHRRGSDWLRHLAHRLVAEAAIVDGWGDPAGWLRESLAFFDGRGEARIAAACRSLLRRAGSPVPRRGRGSADVPLGLRALGVTSREMDVLRLVAGGLSNAGIAEHLCISSRTVETHVASLMRKIGAARRQDLRQVAISVSQPTKSGSDPDAGEATDSARLWT